jgi:hypothetical protein
LRTKPPFEPTGTMTAFLHHLRLDQAQHLGAEVVTAIRPAQPAARDRAEAQVHALEPGRVHEDLELRGGACGSSGIACGSSLSAT